MTPLRGSNLILTVREARGIALTPWSFVPDARQKISETDPVSTIVPGERLELSQCCHQWILSPSRLPFRHPGE